MMEDDLEMPKDDLKIMEDDQNDKMVQNLKPLGSPV
jgi:hypothetical protein